MAITKVTTPVTGFESNVDIGLKIPVGTNSNIPTGIEGMIRNDTDEDSGGANSTTAITFYNGSKWKYFNSTLSPVPPVYPTSLKMFLDANNVTSNPGSGAIWTDLTTNSNNGALVGSTFQSGTPKYVNIPGTDASTIRVDLAGSGGTTQVTNLVGGTQPLTVQGYVYFSSSGSVYDYFFCLGNGGGGTIVSIARFSDGRLYIYDGASALFSTYTSSMNTWYNIALTVTGTQYKLYINGVLEYSPAGASKNITTTTAQIGSYSNSSGSYGNNLTGRVGEFRIYHDVLPVADILANFNATKATYGL